MSDRIRDIQSRLKNNFDGGGGDQLMAAAAYFPVFGFIVVGMLRKDDPFCEFHAKQAMRLNLLFIGAYLVILLLENGPIFELIFGEGRALHHIAETVWTLVMIAFLLISGFSAFKAFSDEEWEIPYLEELFDRFREYSPSDTNGSSRRDSHDDDPDTRE